MAEESSGWLSRAWDAAGDFVSDAGEAVTVIMNDPGHAAALVIDGFEKGVADVGGLIIGGLPDLVDLGAERFGYNLYDGSATAAVSNGLKWGVDSIEGMFGIEKPEIRGDGDAFLFGAGRLTGQVTAGALAITNVGAIVGAAQSAVGGAWSLAANGTRAVSAVGSLATGAAVIGGTAVTADLALNRGRVSGSMLTGAGDAIVSAVTGEDGVMGAVNRFVPQGVRDAIEDFMVFMGENPEWARWGSFALAMLAGNGIIGSVVSGIMGDNMLSGIIALAVTGLIAWNLSRAFTNAATGQAAERAAEGPAANPAAAPDASAGAPEVVRRELPPPAAMPAPA